MPSYLDVPLLTTSEAKVLRVVGYQPPSFAGGIQSRPAGPSGWYLPAFDDSAWTSPVLATFDPSFPPDTEIDLRLHGADPPFIRPFPGDPVWATATEPDPEALLLVRMWFTLPTGTLVQTNPVTSTIGTTAMLEEASTMYNRQQSWINGVNGLAITDLNSHVLVGDRNLIAVADPADYRGQDGTYFRDRASDLSCWVKLNLMFAYEQPVVRGRSYAQIVG